MFSRGSGGLPDLNIKALGTFEADESENFRAVLKVASFFVLFFNILRIGQPKRKLKRFLKRYAKNTAIFIGTLFGSYISIGPALYGL